MKQKTLFKLVNNKDSKYTKSIDSPIYEPKNKKPHILELFDRSKSQRLINKINQSNVSKEEKEFLIQASKRHIVFNYQLIADYYSHSSKEMQKLMEDSALVIIDFEKAIELGYVQLSKEIRTQYLEEYGE